MIIQKPTISDFTNAAHTHGNAAGGGAVSGMSLDTAIADVSVSGTTIAIAAGENLAFGNAVYIKSDGKAWLADANAAGLFPADGMATGTVTTGNTATILLSGLARNDAWAWTAGSKLYLSTTAGAMTHTAPSATDDCIQVVGRAISATKILFNPSQDYLTHI